MEKLNVSEVTIKMLLDSGLVNPGDMIVSDTSPAVTAVINAKGEIEFDVNGAKKVFAYPSGAARAVVNLSVNGWKFWKIKKEENYIELSALRNVLVEMHR